MKKQLQCNCDEWKRLLGFLQDENIRLKNSLSEILKSSRDNSLLEEAENFQNNFIKEDQLIRILRHDLAEFDNLLIRDAFEDRKIVKNLRSKSRDLRKNINTAKRQFSILKSQFTNYLSENTLPQ